MGQLDDYIKNSRNSGRSDDQIRAELLKTGWDRANVDASLNQAAGAAPDNSPKKSHAVLWIVGAVILVLIISAGAFGFFVYNKGKKVFESFENQSSGFTDQAPRGKADDSGSGSGGIGQLDWKTHEFAMPTNSTNSLNSLKWQISLPSNYKILSQEDRGGQSGIEAEVFFGESFLSSVPSISSAMLQYFPAIDSSFEEWFADDVSGSSQEGEYIEVGGKQTYYQKIVQKPIVNRQEYEVVTESIAIMTGHIVGASEIMLVFVTTYDLDEEQYSKIFMDVIKTIKFLN